MLLTRTASWKIGISFWIIVSTLFLFSCNESGETKEIPQKSVEEIKTKTGSSPSELVRMPVTADGPVDTVNVAKIVFEENAYNFGAVKEGEVINHVFKFKNTGKVPLLIANAKSTCGCTVPTWPKEPVEPGAESEIKVKFNTAGKEGKQSKPITIIANTYPNDTKVFMNGDVISSKKK